MTIDLQIPAVGGADRIASIDAEPITPTSVVKPDAGAGTQFASHLASSSLTQEPANVVSELSVAKKFEAVFVAQMMASILPEDSEYFGEGFAGDAWRSMLSEQLANVAVKQTDFGIASLIDQNTTSSASSNAANAQVRSNISNDLFDAFLGGGDQ